MTKGNESVHRFDYDIPTEYGTVIPAINLGLTKLEYFAAMAMQGVISRIDIDIYANKEEIAFDSVKLAKALIEELNKEENK